MSDPISYMPWMVKKENTMNECEMCGNEMTTIDYEFCDICPDCLDEEI